MSQAEWAELVEEWRASGQSAREFARSHAVADSALRYWSARLDREKPPRSTTRSRPAGRPARETTAPTLARVVRAADAPAAQAGRVAVVVGEAMVVVERGFDGAHLRDVVRALSEGR